MNNFGQKNLIQKSTTFLCAAICVGAFSLFVVSNAFAVGGTSTLPPCGEWNTVRSFKFRGESLPRLYSVQVSKIPPNKPTPLPGVQVKLMVGGNEYVGTTLSKGELLFRDVPFGINMVGVSVKLPGHRFNSTVSRDNSSNNMYSDAIYMESCK